MHRHRAGRLVVGGLLVCLGSVPRAGFGQPKPTASERETARALMQEGERSSASGDHQAALASYTAAHALMNIPTTGLELARTEARLGRLVEARGLALEVSNTPPGADEPRPFARARSEAAQLARELEARIPSVRTQVTPASAAYSVTIDGVTLPTAARGIAFRTNPGPHVVVVEAAGYVSQRRELTLVEKQALALSVTLVPTAAKSASVGPGPNPAPGAGALGR